MEESISCMEEECLIEKRRTAILKECSELLNEDNRYTKEVFRKLFQDQVHTFILIDKYVSKEKKKNSKEDE